MLVYNQLVSAFRKALPLITTSFINKTGTIAISIIPMLLVERNFSVEHSSLTMSSIRFVSLFGTLFGGISCDYIGLRSSLLLSFLLTAIGCALLPHSINIYTLLLAAGIVQLGNAMFPAAARLMITSIATPAERQESIGWLRTANNSGQIVSFLVAATLAGSSLAFMFYFDGLTSFAAFIVGAFLIRDTKITTKDNDKVAAQERTQKRASVDQWITFILCALTTAGFSFFYETFMMGSSALARIKYGNEGLHIFSKMMMINAILCGILAVPASRYLKNPRRAFPAGIILAITGLLIIFSGSKWSAVLAHFNEKHLLFIGAFIMTIAEVYFMALSSYTIIMVTPKVKAQGTIYGVALLFQQMAKIIGAGLVFPLVVHSPNPTGFIFASGGLVLILSLMAGSSLRRTHPHH